MTCIFLALVVLVGATNAAAIANISGMKFNDLNSNSNKDAGEPGLASWTIILRNATTGAEVARTTTDADGSYKFSYIDPGIYTVEEVLQPGWSQTKPVPIPPGTYTVTLSGTDVTNLDFGNNQKLTPTPTPTPTPIATSTATVTATTPAPTTPAPTTPAPTTPAPTTPAPTTPAPTTPAPTTPAPTLIPTATVTAITPAPTTPAPTLIPTATVTAITPAPTTPASTLIPIATVTATTPATTSTQIDFSKIVEDELKKLAAGRILFNPPQEMTVGETERVEVRLTKTSIENLSNESLTEGTRGRGEPQIESVKVGTFMKVHLTRDNFDIKALSEEEQIVLSEGFTQWEYDVTPLKDGAQKLRIDVIVRIIISNVGEQKRDYGVYEKQINVKVNPVYSTRTFMENNWQWILTTIIGLSGAIIGWTMKKRGNQGKKKYLQKKLNNEEALKGR